MRLRARTHIAAVVGLSSVVAAAGVIAPGAAAQRQQTNVSCALTLFATIKQPAPTAANFGPARCAKPFGTGVQQDSSTTTRTSLTTGSFAGPFKLFFDRGTIKGRFRISFVTTLSPTNQITGVTYKGTLRVTGGSAAYRRVRGSGTVRGESPDAVQTTLAYRLNLTGIPRR